MFSFCSPLIYNRFDNIIDNKIRWKLFTELRKTLTSLAIFYKFASDLAISLCVEVANFFYQLVILGFVWEN